jgi:L-alanine-DL-glutamate epimerase-like enolase superfamily enzyme
VESACELNPSQPARRDLHRARTARRAQGRAFRAAKRTLANEDQSRKIKNRRPHERQLRRHSGRTNKLLELAQKKLAGKVTLMADANGSYDAKNAIELGKRLQEMKYLWFEEPCPWEELSETKRVADALEMKIAFGEQNSSLWQFQYIIDNQLIDIVQPDLNYNGGFVRAAKVARMARKVNMWICPHDTQTGAATVNILQFAATTPNIGPFMEYVSRKEPKKHPGTRPISTSKTACSRSPPARAWASNSTRTSSNRQQ